MVFLDSVKNENGDAKEGSRQRLVKLYANNSL
jgi:hypothetical protein